MIFVQPLTIPASTLETSPVIAEMQLSAGTITLVAIQFPSGVNALAHLQIWHGLHQLFPTNQDGDFATGAETIVWDEQEELSQPPFSITLRGWNDDTTFQHVVTVRIVMVPLNANPALAQEVALLLEQGAPGVEGPSTFPVVNP